MQARVRRDQRPTHMARRLLVAFAILSGAAISQDTAVPVLAGGRVMAVDVGAGWNLVGGSPLAVWSGASPASTWTWNAATGQWSNVSGTPPPGAGAWEQIGAAGSYSIDVEICDSPTTVGVTPHRWNLVGNPCDGPVSLPTGTTALLWSSNAGRYLRSGQIPLGAAGWVQPASSSLVLTRQDPTIMAAGDIACDPSSPYFNAGDGTTTDCRMKATSDLLVSGSPQAVLMLGDGQYPDASLSDFQASYDPTWGRVKSITYPIPGNHEYQSGSAGGYFQYFGAAAHPESNGYYSFDIGTWHIIALNPECTYLSGGCASGSAEEQWLRADLASHPGRCTLAFWHEPRFASGPISGDTAYVPFWQDLYNAGADIVLNGHVHGYERFALQDPQGNADANGVREFIVGTGGDDLWGSPTSNIQPNSEVRDGTTFGVLKLALRPASYQWQFVPANAAGNGTFTDSGSAACHHPG